MKSAGPARTAAKGRTDPALAQAADPELATRTLSRPGQPLEAGLRHEMEGRFGQDFGGVRVHADGLAARSARAERASAYTVGESIVFGPDRPSPVSPAGRLLVAHELAHVIQQRRGGAAGPGGPGGPGAPAGSGAPGAVTGVEEGADRAALDVALGRRPRVSGAGGPRLARAPDDSQHQSKYAEWGQSYQTLRRLEEQAYHRVHELHGQAQAYEAAQRQKRASTTGKQAGDAPDLSSYNVQYSVHEGKLVSYVSAEKGKRRGVQLKPGEVWVGAGGAHSDEERHAERNTLRLGPGEPITAVASRPHCEHCTQALIAAGATTGGERVNPGRMGGASKKKIEDERTRMLALPHQVGTALERISTIKDPSSPRPDPQVLGRGGPGRTVTGSGQPAPAPGTPVTAPATDTAHAAAGSGIPHDPSAIGSAHAAAGPGAGPPPSASSVAHPSPGAKDAQPGPGAGVPHVLAAAGTTGTAPATTGIRPPAAARTEDRQPRERGEQIAPGVFRRRKAGSDPGTDAERQGTAPARSAEAAWPQFVDFVKGMDPKGKTGGRRRRREDESGQEETGPPKRAKTRTPPRAPSAAVSSAAVRSPAPTPTRVPTAPTRAPTAPAGVSAPAGAGRPAPASAMSPAHDQAPSAHGTPPPAPTGSPSVHPGTPAAPAAAAPAHAMPSVQPAAPPATHGGAEPAAAPPPARKPPSPSLPNVAPSGGRATPPGPPSGSGGSGGTGPLSAGHPPPVAGSPQPATAQAGSPTAAAEGAPAKSTTQPDPTKPKTKLTWTGVSRKKTEEERSGDVVAATSKTTALSRDKGKLGIGSTTTRRFGQEDEQGNLVRGHEVSRSRSGGLVAGPGGVGGFGKADAEATQAHGGGLKTTQSIGVDGQATVDVKPVPGTTPAQYKMTVTLTLGGHAKVGGSLDRGGLGANASASAQGSVTGVFEHTFSKEQVDAYLGALKDPAIGGAHKEFAIMRLATQGSLQEAKSVLAAVGAAGFSAQAIRDMKEGDASEVTVQGGAELKGGASAKSEVFGISLGGSLSRSGSLRRRVAIQDGKAVVTVEVLAGKGASGEASVSVFGAEAGGGYGEVETTGESVTFSADPKDTTSLGRIAAVDSAAALRSLAAAPGGATVVSRTESRAKTTTSSAKVGLGPVEAEVGSEHTYGEKTITGPQGVTKEYTGGSGGRLAVGAKGGPKVAYGEKDTVTLGGGPDNQGYGDVSTKTTQTDPGKNVRDAKKAPVRTALGLATGGAPVLAEGEEVVGMKLSDADFNRLSGAASDNKAWNKAFTDSGSRVNQSLTEAARLMAKVQAAQGDRKAIAQAFAQYAKDNDNAAKFVQEMVRPRGETEGGRRYDWPAEYSAEQSVYESLVLGDPGAEADRLAASGQVPGAVQRLQDAITQLETVAGTVNANRDRFSDKAAVIEMVRSIRRRQGDLNTKIQQLQPAPHPEAAKADPANQDPAKAEGPPKGADSGAQPPPEAKAGPDPARVNSLNDQVRKAIADIQPNRANEQEQFARVDSEYHHFWRNPDPITIFGILNELRDHVYPQWDKQINELKGFYQELGQDPNQALQYGPDRAGWRQRRNTPEMTKG